MIRQRSLDTRRRGTVAVITALCLTLLVSVVAITLDVGILVLDPTGKGAFNAQGSGTSTVNGTPIIVDSNNPEAAIAGGGGTVIAPEFDITGSYTTTGGGSFSGDIHTGRTPMGDPLA